MFRLQMHRAFFLIVSGLAAGSVSAALFSGVVPGAGLIHVQSGSLRSQKFVHLVRQHTDFSCGAAALATILRYSYHRPVTEQEVLQGLYRVSNPKVVREQGFSLMDIKRYVEVLGMKGVGFKVPASALPRLKVPSIVLLNLNGYEHFVVLRRVRGQVAYLADPALGQRSVPLGEFAHDWNGIIFAVLGAGFDPHNVLLRPRGPVGVSDKTMQQVVADRSRVVDFGYSTSVLF